MAVAGAVLLAIVLGAFEGRAQTPAASGPVTATPADYLRWRTEMKNWGRWGATDQLGVSNLITAAKIQTAARLVKSGVVVSLAHPVPQKTEADVPAASVFHRTTNIVSDTSTSSC